MTKNTLPTDFSPLVGSAVSRLRSCELAAAMLDLTIASRYYRQYMPANSEATLILKSQF